MVPGVLFTSPMLNGLAQNIEHYMDLLSARQKLVSSNIANADTPGYKTRDLDFASEFQNSLNGFDAESVEVTGLKMKNDGNNVSVDRESRLLAENALRFNLATQLLRSQIRTLRTAIQEGRNS